jgi:hypothetical protein
MELKPFYYEAQVALAGDFTLHLVLDLSAVDRLERLFDLDIDDVFAAMLSSVSVMAKVLWGLTRAHHADLDLNQVTGILLPGDPAKQDLAQAVAAAIGDLFKRALIVVPETKPQAKSRGKRS